MVVTTEGAGRGPAMPRHRARTAVRDDGRSPGAWSRAGLAAGPLGAVLFVAVFTVAGAVRPEYDAFVYPVSALALGPQGWVLDVAFLVFALCVAAFGCGLRARMVSGVGARSAPLVMAATAACLVVLAVCRQDAMTGDRSAADHTLVGTTHIVASALLAALLVAHCAVMCARFRRTPGAGRWAVFSGATGVVGLGLMVAYVVVLVGMEGGPGGLLERAAVVAMAAQGTAVAAWFARSRG